MSDVVEKLAKSTCKVIVDEIQHGSAFLVSENELLTAYHVIKSSQSPYVKLFFEGETVNARAKILRVNKAADLALLRLIDKLKTKRDHLNCTEEIPNLGEEVVWCGFAQLIGEEDISRIRMGWGRVASRPYKKEGGIFFEVDGLFNPGHSGGPVVLADTGEVVGVIKASAGSIEPLINEWRDRAEKIQILSYLASKSFRGGGFFTTVRVPDEETANKMIEELRRLGLTVDQPTRDEGMFVVNFQRDEILLAISRFLSELAESLVVTADMTFQMGLGIASGGKPLMNILKG